MFICTTNINVTFQIFKVKVLRFALIPFILNCLLVGQHVCTDFRTDFGPILITDTPLGFLAT